MSQATFTMSTDPNRPAFAVPARLTGHTWLKAGGVRVGPLSGPHGRGLAAADAWRPEPHAGNVVYVAGAEHHTHTVDRRLHNRTFTDGRDAVLWLIGAVAHAWHDGAITNMQRDATTTKLLTILH